MQHSKLFLWPIYAHCQATVHVGCFA